MKTHINIFHGKAFSEFETVVSDIVPEGLNVVGETELLNTYEFGEYKHSVDGLSVYRDVFIDVPDEIYNKLNLFKDKDSNHRNVSVAVFLNDGKLYKSMNLSGIFVKADRIMNLSGIFVKVDSTYYNAGVNGYVRLQYVIKDASIVEYQPSDAIKHTPGYN